MLLPISWLKQYVTVVESPAEVAERFVNLGFETERLDNDRLDLEITPNRGDCLSIIGLAREYAASTGQTATMPPTTELTTVESLSELAITAEPNAYHRLAATTVRGLKDQSSPDWLKRAVESVGMNSIDLIVDLTNYVMFELGIPLHAFDIDKLPAKTLQVRLSHKGEPFTSLKQEEVKLPEGVIVVQSGQEVIDLLGIRGGQSSMIAADTQHILVWAASVPRPLIRKAVKATGIRTEGAYRHERETDWLMVSVALRRFIYLLNQSTTANSDSLLELTASPYVPKQIPYQVKAINQLLGTTYSESETNEALQALGFTLTAGRAEVPSWRYFDIDFAEDLAEEVARIKGYTKLPHLVISGANPVATTEYAKAESLKDELVAAGLTEVYTESFSGRQEVSALGLDGSHLAELANPVNHEFAYCRPSMIPNLLKLLAQNAWSDDARVFELGTVFPARDQEVVKLALAAYGKQEPLFSLWVPVETIKTIQPTDSLGQFFKLRRPVTIAEAVLSALKLQPATHYQPPATKPHYQPVSSFPPSVRDLAIIIDKSIDPAAVKQTIQSTGPETILLVELFDQYVSDSFGPDKQSLAFHIVYQSMVGTLETTSVDQLHEQITAILKERYQAKVR